MKSNLYLNAVAFIFIICVLFCGAVFAGPATNAQQFQRKAVDSALKGSGDQDFEPKQQDGEDVEWVEHTDQAADDGYGKNDDAAPLVPINRTGPVVED